MKRTVITSILAIVIGVAVAEAQPYFRHGQGGGQRRPQRETYYRGDNGFRSSFVPYKGFLEMGYAAGIGDNRADRLDILTTHGLQVSNNTFVGIGGGLSVSFNNDDYAVHDYDYHTTGVSIPLYVDFRFGNTYPSRGSWVQPFFDFKIGAQFRVSDDTLVVGRGYYDGTNSFYMSPSVGIRIPTGGKSAVNLAATYNLTTHRIADWSGNSYYCDAVQGLSSFGVRLSFVW